MSTFKVMEYVCGCWVTVGMYADVESALELIKNSPTKLYCINCVTDIPIFFSAAYMDYTAVRD